MGLARTCRPGPDADLVGHAGVAFQLILLPALNCSGLLRLCAAWARSTANVLTVPPNGVAKLHFGAHFQAPGLPNQTAGTVDVYGLQILDATLETGNSGGGYGGFDTAAEAREGPTTSRSPWARCCWSSRSPRRHFSARSIVRTCTLMPERRDRYRLGAALTATGTIEATLSSTGAVLGSLLSITGAASVGLLSLATGIMGSAVATGQGAATTVTMRHRTTGPSARSARQAPQQCIQCQPFLHLPQHKLLRHEGAWHNITFHMQLQNALFVSGLQLLLAILRPQY